MSMRGNKGPQNDKWTIKDSESGSEHSQGKQRGGQGGHKKHNNHQNYNQYTRSNSQGGGSPNQFRQHNNNNPNRGGNNSNRTSGSGSGSGGNDKRKMIERIRAGVNGYYDALEIENYLKELSNNFSIQINEEQVIAELLEKSNNSYSSKVSGQRIEVPFNNTEKKIENKTNGQPKPQPKKTENTQTTQNVNNQHQNNQPVREQHHQNQTREEEKVTVDDFKDFHRTLTEKQLLLNKQTETLNRILDEYNHIKETKTKQIEDKKAEKDKLESKKQKLLDEINNISKHVKELDEDIATSEKDLINQLKTLQKKAEPFKTHH